MPIYMDRHYIQGATAHAIAIAHTSDLAIQDRYRVRFLTYWFDEVRSTAFCLVDSPDRDTIRRAHRESHGLVPNEIIEVDPTVVEAFLGRVADPIPADPRHLETAIDAAFRAIMFTDLKDSTLITSTQGDTRGLHLVHVSNVITRSSIRTYRDERSSTRATALWPAFPLSQTRLRAPCRFRRRWPSTTGRHQTTR